LYSYDRNLKLEIPKCICHDASEVFPREIYERVKNSFARTYGEAAGYRETSDLFRYKLLYEKGGWYFDTDCLLLKPLTPLFDRDYVFGWELPIEVNNAVLKFPKGEPMLDQLYKECLQKNSEKDLPWGIPLFNEYLKKFNLINRALPRNYFYPISPIEKEQQVVPEEDGSYILHLYTGLKYNFDPRIQSLEKQIEALNKSIGLRLTRKIPFGEQIRKILVKNERENAHNPKQTPTPLPQTESPPQTEPLPQTLPPKISLIILTLNEENYIGQCIEYHKLYCDETIVVDGGSTDRTVEIATDRGARVLVNKSEDYGSVRNFGMDQAKNDWALFVDADELFDPKFLNEMKQLIQTHPNVIAFKISRWNLNPTAPHKIGDYQVRLMNRKYCDCRGLVHDRVFIRGTHVIVFDGDRSRFYQEDRPIIHLPKTPEARAQRYSIWAQRWEKEKLVHDKH